MCIYFSMHNAELFIIESCLLGVVEGNLVRFTACLIFVQCNLNLSKYGICNFMQSPSCIIITRNVNDIHVC